MRRRLCIRPAGTVRCVEALAASPPPPPPDCVRVCVRVILTQPPLLWCVSPIVLARAHAGGWEGLFVCMGVQKSQ